MARRDTQPPAFRLPQRLVDLTLEDLEAVRHLLRGSSVIDWHHLDFHDHEAVDRFLRINEFDPESPDDVARLEDIRSQAVEYLTEEFEFAVPDAIAHELPARDLFLVASRKSNRQLWACVTLKVMHIVHHLAGRELSTQLPISSDQIYNAIELKVMSVIETLRAGGLPIVEFQWSRKSPTSLITKLLAKRSTLAASIYDKLRFRMIVRKREDLPSVMAALHRRLIPFNYVVPGQSVNHLIDFAQFVDADDSLRTLKTDLQTDKGLEKKLDRAASLPVNEFSAKEYRIVNFIADLPVRVDHLVEDFPQGFGHVVFVLTEFQLVDGSTAETNELGDSSHDAYKDRQRRSVRLRLMRGRRSTRLTKEPEPERGVDGE